MIRRLVWGCLPSVLLFLLVLGTLVYFVVIKPIQVVLDAVKVRPGGIGGMYVPPRDGHLSRSQVERFIRIQRYTRQSLGSDYNRLADAYQKVTGGDFSANDLLNTFSNVGNLIGNARTAQGTVLTQEKMSLSEYNWVRGEVYKALGVDYAGIDLGGLAQRFNGSGFLQLLGFNYTLPNLPGSKNAALVKPFRDELRKTSHLALLGI